MPKTFATLTGQALTIGHGAGCFIVVSPLATAWWITATPHPPYIDAPVAAKRSSASNSDSVNPACTRAAVWNGPRN